MFWVLGASVEISGLFYLQIICEYDIICCTFVIMLKSRTRDIFDFSEPWGLKKYKVYGFFNSDGLIIYIGVTNQPLKNRLSAHISNCDPIKIREDFYNDCILTGKKISVRILFDFDNKIFAALTERVLITFCYKFINKKLWNNNYTVEENYYINYKHTDKNVNVY